MQLSQFMRTVFVLTPFSLLVTGCVAPAPAPYYGSYGSTYVAPPPPAPAPAVGYYGPVVPPVGVQVIAPIGVAPGIGWGWAYHPHRGWGWHHNHHGWRHH